MLVHEKWGITYRLFKEMQLHVLNNQTLLAVSIFDWMLLLYETRRCLTEWNPSRSQTRKIVIHFSRQVFLAICTGMDWTLPVVRFERFSQVTLEVLRRKQTFRISLHYGGSLCGRPSRPGICYHRKDISKRPCRREDVSDFYIAFKMKMFDLMEFNTLSILKTDNYPVIYT